MFGLAALPALAAAGGTAAGAGGMGAAIGAMVGAGTSFADMSAREKAQERTEDRPKRRRLAKFQQMIGQAMNNKQRALIAMAQAHQNFASMW